MNTLLAEILQWLQNNNYRRASFDRIVGIVPSAATYDQLYQLVDQRPDIFRSATMKGGLPGLVLQDDVNITEELNTLRDPSAAQGYEALTIGFGTPIPASAPIVESTTPSVTENEVDAEIHSEYYINVGEAVGAWSGPTTRLTLCVLVLKNEFTIVGKSACVYPELYDPEKGRQLARADAVRHVWPLLGFRLADKRAAG
jgi:hypothetical protein